MKIHFVVPNSNKGWAYPFLKWKKDFKRKGFDIEVVSQLNHDKSKVADITILTSRYYTKRYKTNKIYFKNVEKDLLKDVRFLRTTNSKIVFYELSDSTGSRELHIIKHVDLFLKRQLFKDKSIYSNHKHPYRIWLENSNFFKGCHKNQLHKIALGWNLGYKDYANWPILNPLKFNRLFFKDPDYSSITKRSLTATFRGRMKGQAVPQRQETMTVLKKLSKKKPDSFITGGIIKKKAYLKEVRNSKSIISPYGYGEICYRDMEAFIHGCILVKPSMEHLETFPNVFIKNQTYIPVKWDLSDLKEVLVKIDENYNDYIDIAKAGQENFKKYYDSFEIFYEHFKAIVKKVLS